MIEGIERRTKVQEDQESNLLIINFKWTDCKELLRIEVSKVSKVVTVHQ